MLLGELKGALSLGSERRRSMEGKRAALYSGRYWNIRLK